MVPDRKHGSDTVSGLSQAYASKNVLGAGGSTLNVSGYTVNDGNGGANYAVTTQSATGTISPAALTITGASAANKVYDGTTAATVSGGSLSGLVVGDKVTLSQSGAFLDKNAGTGKTVSYASSLSGAGAGNYALTSSSGSTTADIAPALLSVTVNDDAKLADGTAYSGGNGISVSGLVGGDTSSVLGGHLSYGGSAQGATQAGRYTLSASGLGAANYSLQWIDGTLTITSSIADQLPRFDSTALFGGSSSRSSSSGKDSRAPQTKTQAAVQFAGGGCPSRGATVLEDKDGRTLLCMVDGGVR